MQTIKRKENLIAVGVALALSAIIFIAVQNSSFLTADIAGTQVAYSEDSDLVSYVEDNTLIVAASRDFEDVKSVSMLIFFDPETATIARDGLESNYNISYTPANRGRASLTVSGDIGSINKRDMLVSLSVDGEVRDVTVSDIVVTFTDNSTASVSLAVK